LNPPAGAGPVREIVAVTLVPPITEAGLTVKDLTTGGLTVRVVVCFPAAVLAEMVAPVALPTGIVLIAKVAVVFVAATVADAGTVATELVLPSFTTTPPVGAGAERVIVPFEPAPPRTLAGETETWLTDCPHADATDKSNPTVRMRRLTGKKSTEIMMKKPHCSY